MGERSGKTDNEYHSKAGCGIRRFGGNITDTKGETDEKRDHNDRADGRSVRGQDHGNELDAEQSAAVWLQGAVRSGDGDGVDRRRTHTVGMQLKSGISALPNAAAAGKGTHLPARCRVHAGGKDPDRV